MFQKDHAGQESWGWITVGQDATSGQLNNPGERWWGPQRKTGEKRTRLEDAMGLKLKDCEGCLGGTVD